MNRKIIALVAASSLLATLLVAAPASAATADGAYPSDGAGTAAFSAAALPIVEPALGIGAPLRGGEATTVTLAGPESSAHTALVRLTLTAAPADTTVSVAGFPALGAAAGESATAVVLAPVQDGAISVQSDADAEVRVERLAAFSSAVDAPGSIHALGAPAVAVDSVTGAGLAQSALDKGALGTINLRAGQGMPSEAVRAAFVTLVATNSADSSLVFDGQSLDLPAGRSVITTVVTPDALGQVDFSVSSGSIDSLRAAVTGYVVEPSDNPVALQGAGAYVPVDGARTIEVDAARDQNVAVDAGAPAGSVATLALLLEARSDVPAVLDLEAAHQRTSGAVIDGATFTPQLVVVPDGANALARGGDVTATLLPLGDILGDVEASAADAAIRLSSPSSDTIDATETWTTTFEGTWEIDGDVPLRVEVTLDGAAYGSAHLTPTGWEFTAALPASGEHTFAFTLVARGGARATAEWRGNIIVPDASDTVLNDTTVVLGESDGITGYSDGTVTFDRDPGLVPDNVLVAGVTAATPSGFIARVVSVELIDGVWVVHTTAATLTDVFLQAHVDDELPVGAGEVAEASSEPQEETVDGAPVTGDPVVASWTTTDQTQLELVDPVDALDDSPVSSDEAAAAGASGSVPAAVGPAAAVGAPAKLFGAALAAAHAALTPAATYEPASIAQWIEAEFTYGSNIKVVAKAQIKLALKVTIDVEVRWTEGSWWPPKPPVPYPWLNEFATVLESSATASAVASAEVSKSFSWSKSKSFTKSFTPISFMVGPVPVVITTQVGLKLEASLSISGNAKAVVTTTYARTQELGFRFKDGVAGLVDPSPKTTVSAPKFSDDTGLSASFSADAGPTLTFTAKLWDLAGPQLGLSLKAALTADGKATVGDPFFAASAELAIVGAFFVKVLVTVPVIDKKLVDKTLLNKSKKWTIWKGSFNLKNFLSPGPPAPTPGASETDYGSGTLTPAPDVLSSIEVVGAEATGAYFIEGPPHSSAFAVRTSPAGGFPTEGSDYIAMSTGSLARLDGDQTEYFSGVPSNRAGQVYDVTTLRIDLKIPSGVNCLVGLDFRFYSDEYPEYVGSQFNDAFVAEFGKTSWEVNGYDVYAPRNFAFDQLGNPITINAAGAATMTAENAEGTPYDGGTRLLRATSPVVSGPTSLFLSIFDQGDGVLDSTVFIDRIEFSSVVNPSAQCAAGVVGG